MGVRSLSSPKILCITALMLAVLLPCLARGQKPGAYYWADSDGNGQIEIPDLSTLVNVLGGPSADDTLIYQGHPQSRFRQDLDGNGIIEVPDYSILLGWMTGNYSYRPGNPDRLLLDGSTLSVASGESVTLSAYALSPAACGGAVRTGFGVVFKIDPASDCASAELWGYGLAGGETVNAWRPSAAYHYTPGPGAPEEGRASVKFRPAACAPGQTVTINVFIPSDAESGVVPGRFPETLSAGNITITIVTPGCQQVLAINISPENPMVEPGATIHFRAACTLADSTTVDCTNTYCDGETEWSSSGDLMQLDPPNLVQALMEYGTGTVTADYYSLLTPPLSDSELVTVTDLTPPDTSITSAPPANSNSSLAGFAFICSEEPCTFECKLDASAWAGCDSPVEYAGLAEGAHSFQVRAKDSAGNTDPTPASYAWVIDTVPSVTAITSAPPLLSKSSDASFSFICNDPPCTFDCSLDAEPWLDCSSPVSYFGLGDGPHIFQVLATDAAGNTDPEPASHAWTIDTVPPDTAISSGPPVLSNLTSASFTFTCDEAACSFECKRDSLAWAACSSPVNYSGFINGAHNFQVRAKDLAGNLEPTPAAYAWTVDTIPPNTTITSTPPAKSNSLDAAFAFSCNEALCTFECSLDSMLWTVCSSPADFAGLQDGAHNFQVRAKDGAGNYDLTPAFFNWTIDTVPPDTTINSGPAALSNSSAAVFSITGSEPSCSFECSMDGAPWAACSATINYSGLAEGAHNFQARAKDPAGNYDPQPASYDWTIDTVPPDTSITSAPPTYGQSSEAAFSFTCNEPPCSFECKLDSAAWAGCASPKVYTGLLEGAHSFQVRARDAAGNVDPTPASHAWAFDITPPETVINFFPANPSSQTSATFAFSCTGPPCTFECNLDSLGWAACPSPQTYSGLALSAHTFQVRATDAAGNLDPTPADLTWTISGVQPAIEFGAAPSIGDNRVLVLLVNFADTQPSFTAQDFQEMFFADAPGSMRDFFQKSSYGLLNLSGDVVGWVQVSQTHDYYGNNRAGKGAAYYPRNLYGMAEEAIDQAEAMGVDFSQYDNNNDGWVDSLVIIHQGEGSERSANQNDIRTTMVPLSLGGPLSRFYDGVKIENFLIGPELADLGLRMEIGLIAHEFGHLLGMRDSYAFYATTQFGVGNFDLMSYGSSGGDNRSLDQPILPSPLQKELTGWLNPRVITADTILYIPPVETSAYAAKILFDNDDRNYFIISNHQPLGYDQKIPASGVLVWHVDKKSYLGNAWSAPLPGKCSANTIYFHPMLALEQADGLFDLEKGLNVGNATDSFPAGAGFSTQTATDSYTYQCFPSGVEINVLDSNTSAIKVQARLNRFQNNFTEPRFWLKDFYFQPIAGRADSDQYPEANEELYLLIKLMNTGTLAQSVSVQVGSTSPYVESLTPTADYPDLQAGDSAFNATPIQIAFKDTGCEEANAVIQLRFSANDGAYSWSLNRNIVIGHPAVLLVDDDGGERTEDLFLDAFENGGLAKYSYAKWETATQGVPSLKHLQDHGAVIWVCGPEQNPLSANEIMLLKHYLDAGGRLVLSSAYLLLNTSPAIHDFAENYLGLDYWVDNGYAIQNVFGINQNPVSHGANEALLLTPNYVPIYPRNVGLLPATNTMPVFFNNRGNAVMVQRYSQANNSGVVFSSFGLEHLNRTVLYLNSPPIIRRMLNAAKYQPGQPVVINAQPASTYRGATRLSLVLTGINFNANTIFSFPEPGIQIVSKTFNSTNQTFTLVITILSSAHPGWHKIAAQNPGLPSANYDRYLFVR